MEQEKVDIKKIASEYNKKPAIDFYNKISSIVGLWKSEEFVFNKFVPKNSKILDLCCGSGRTTFGLYDLGYNDLTGVDMSKKLIFLAKKKARSLPVKFLIDNLFALNFDSESFDVVFLSYNGLMAIPKYENRCHVVNEISRVLKPSGLFIFTTHDRNDSEENKLFWKQEKLKWINGTNDERLLEYGDRFVKHEGQELFVHVPDTKEVYAMLSDCGFDCIYTKMRWDICVTPKAEKEMVGECRFFVAKKRI